MSAQGTFDVTLSPLECSAPASEDNALGRMSIVKTFAGDLQAESRGEMLSVRTPTAGSAGYVALERVEGKLGGKQGSFVLQHFGIMAGGNNRLVLEVVPDSGTGELVGLSGSMTIDIVDGEHRYGFEYALG